MVKMGAYCKAYQLKQLRKFKGWPKTLPTQRKETQTIAGEECETNRDLTDEDVLYLQESFIVTDGLFSDRNIVFDSVTDKWKLFCQNELHFSVPDYTRKG